jgi:hypothetical protein
LDVEAAGSHHASCRRAMPRASKSDAYNAAVYPDSQSHA